MYLLTPFLNSNQRKRARQVRYPTEEFWVDQAKKLPPWRDYSSLVCERRRRCRLGFNGVLPKGTSRRATFLSNFANVRVRSHRGEEIDASVIRTGSTPLRSLAGAPTDYGVLVYVFLLLGLPTAFLVVYGLLLVANLGYLVLALPKWFRDMTALDPNRAPPKEA